MEYTTWYAFLPKVGQDLAKPSAPSPGQSIISDDEIHCSLHKEQTRLVVHEKYGEKQKNLKNCLSFNIHL